METLSPTPEPTTTPVVADEPKFLVEALQPTSTETCDRCGIGTQAIFAVVVSPLYDPLTLCWHHATTNPRVGPKYVDFLNTQTYLHNDQRSKGDDHA